MTVEIPNEVSTYVERCWFEWDSVMKVLNYITHKHSLDEHIEYYTKLVAEKNFILEQAKKEAIRNCLTGLDPNKMYKYDFDFDNSSIIYEEA